MKKESPLFLAVTRSRSPSRSTSITRTCIPAPAGCCSPQYISPRTRLHLPCASTRTNKYQAFRVPPDHDLVPCIAWPRRAAGIAISACVSFGLAISIRMISSRPTSPFHSVQLNRIPNMRRTASPVNVSSEDGSELGTLLSSEELIHLTVGVGMSSPLEPVPTQPHPKSLAPHLSSAVRPQMMASVSSLDEYQL